MSNETTEQEPNAELGGRVDAFVRRDYADVANKFTDVVAAQMHYFDRVDGVDLNLATADEIRNLSDGWILRYRNDHIFKLRVTSTVSQLMAVVTDA